MLLTIHEFLDKGYVVASPAAHAKSDRHSFIVFVGRSRVELGCTYSFFPKDFFYEGQYIRGIIDWRNPVSQEELAHNDEQSRLFPGEIAYCKNNSCI